MTMLTGDRDSWATREDVHRMGKDILEHMDRQSRQDREHGDNRHIENIGNFRELMAESRLMNVRVTTLETLVKTLQAEFQGIRDRWHTFRDSIVKSLSDNGVGTGENRKLVMRDFTIAFGGVSLGITLFYALAKILKWL